MKQEINLLFVLNHKCMILNSSRHVLTSVTIIKQYISHLIVLARVTRPEMIVGLP
jgi:hypothetical protein